MDQFQVELERVQNFFASILNGDILQTWSFLKHNLEPCEVFVFGSSFNSLTKKYKLSFDKAWKLKLNPGSRYILNKTSCPGFQAWAQSCPPLIQEGWRAVLQQIWDFSTKTRFENFCIFDSNKLSRIFGSYKVLAAPSTIGAF